MQQKPQDGVVIGAGTVRGTQSFVHTMMMCWKRPSLTALEVAWRWAFGVPTLLVLRYEWMKVLEETPLDFAALRKMSLLDPMSAAGTLAKAMDVLLPPVVHLLAWPGPLLIAVWLVISSVGRTMVLRRADPALHARAGTLIVLQAIRILALLGSFVVWFAGLQWAAGLTVTGPIAVGGEPNLVVYFAWAITITLCVFVAWAAVSWVLSVAPLLAMLRGLSIGRSLAAALRLRGLRPKLVEINLVMGIVKIALIVLAMVFSASPLPFESVTTPEFLAFWWTLVTILYLIASDFFHVVRQVAYLELWRAYDVDPALNTA